MLRRKLIALNKVRWLCWKKKQFLKSSSLSLKKQEKKKTHKTGYNKDKIELNKIEKNPTHFSKKN